MKNKKTGKIALGAVLTALALVLSYVETLFPLNLGVPGAKLGLANLAMMFALYLLGPAEAVSVSVLRILLSGLLFGNAFAVVYSLSGFAFSFLSMLLLKKTEKFGITGVSAAGGVMHNLGQLAAAALLAGPAVAAYFPWLFACGLISGIIIGILGGILVNRLRDVVK